MIFANEYFTSVDITGVIQNKYPMSDNQNSMGSHKFKNIFLYRGQSFAKKNGGNGKKFEFARKK